MIDCQQLLIDANSILEESFEWGTLKWICNDKLSPGALQTIGWCKIFPGKRNPLHYHPNCEEALLVIRGRGQHRLNEHCLTLEPGMLLRVPSGVLHNFENCGSIDLECMITFSSGDRQTIFVE